LGPREFGSSFSGAIDIPASQDGTRREKAHNNTGAQGQPVGLSWTFVRLRTGVGSRGRAIRLAVEKIAKSKQRRNLTSDEEPPPHRYEVDAPAQLSDGPIPVAACVIELFFFPGALEAHFHLPPFRVSRLRYSVSDLIAPHLVPTCHTLFRTGQPIGLVFRPWPALRPS